MSRNKTITGRVPLETIDKLFQLGNLASPDKVEGILHKYRKSIVLKDYRKATDAWYALPKWRQRLTQRPHLTHSMSFDLDMPLSKWCGQQDKRLQEYAFAVEDTRTTIEVLSVAKQSLGQSVYADNITLVTLNRVIQYSDWYINLDVDLQEYLEIL